MSPPPPPLTEIVLTASPDNPITAFDLSSSASLAHFNGSRCPRNGLTVIGINLFAASHVSPDTGAGSLHIYNWCSPSSEHTIPLPEPVAPLAATIDGSYLFSGGISGKIHALSIPSCDLIRSFTAHEKPVSCLRINYDGSLLLSGSDDGTIAVFPIFALLDSSFNTDLGCSIFSRFNGHESSVTGLTTGVGRCSSVVISSSLDWTCKLWSLVSGTHLRTVRFPCSIWSTIMDPLETEFYAGGSNGIIYKGLLKVQTRKQVVQGGEMVVWGEMNGGAVVAMEMLKYGEILATASENGGIWIWEVKKGKMIRAVCQEMGGVSGLVVAKGGPSFKVRGIGDGKCGGNKLSRPVREVMEMEEVLKVVVQDRSRAINNLESAIGVYEKLLELMLREAKVDDDLNKNGDHDG